MIFWRAIRYLKYFLQSRHWRGHGIHSPFVFDLVSRVFRHKTDPELIATIEKIRKKMISDRRSVLVRDLGSRSEPAGSDVRRVSDIARKSPVPAKYGKLLSNIAMESGKSPIIELGTSLGISTMYLASACPDRTVYTIEGCPSTASIARQNFTDAGLPNIKLIEGSFEEVIPSFVTNGITPGLVFIDGNHRKEPVIEYFNQIAGISDSKTVIIIDDIYYSKEMAEAWTLIRMHKKVSVSIDIFRMGILFLREGISHSKYIIRY